MRKFKVTFTLYHESFGGYDHCDGEWDCIVEARGEKSAINAAIKKIPWGHWVGNKYGERKVVWL